MEALKLVSAGILVSWILFSVGAGELNSSAPCDFPAIFNFGDSNSDTGCMAAAFIPEGPPCGETFFHEPAGRASDGRLIIDFIAKHLGLPYLSAYINSLGTTYRQGANFAAGGSTIRRQNETFFDGGCPFTLEIQIAQFDQFKARTGKFFTQGKKHSYTRHVPRPEEFAKAIYTFDIGQNDVARMSNQDFVQVIPDIVEQFAKEVQHLYQQGARTFWIHNTGPIGCLPITTHSVHNPEPGYADQNGCVKEQNDMAKEFNRQLKNIVVKLRAKLNDAALTYVDIFSAKYELISNAKEEGFVDPARICCGYHEDDNHVNCGNKGIVNGTEFFAGTCEDPSLHISWDGVHYTEAANHWIAKRVLSGSFSDPPIPITHSCQRH
ncbi:GDSL esterase/lipase [Quillaja saponaria]|uniref:GDSL esterase/lipase n=1 Tax=Quillaja saponaria TaxID=32244 RepID=A0AAD7VGD0_QUISA|nr:GDSL esterase/lipase [Quillaja saponaria]